MLSFRNLSIRRKQMLIIMLTSSVALLLACAAFVAYDVSNFRRELVESVASLAEVVGNSTTAALDFNDPETAAQTLAALRGEPTVVVAHVYTPDGQTFATYVRAGAQLPPEIPYSLAARHEFTATHLHLFRPITQGGEQVGTIELIADLHELRERLWSYAGIAGLVLAVSLLAAFGLSNRLQKLISDPILHLAHVARSVALEENYSVRATKRSNDELGQLVDGFNQMLGQIQERDAALQSARGELEGRVIERTTELASANQALQNEAGERERAQSFLNSVVENLPIPVFIKEAGELRFVLWNKAGEKLTGITNAEMIGKNDYDFFPAKDAELYIANDRAAFEKRSVLEISEETIQTRHHGARITHVRKVPIFDATGQPAFLLGISEDITERKQAATALQQSEERFRLLVEESPDVIGIYQDGRLVFINSTGVRLFGAKTSEELLGRKSEQMIHPDDLAGAMDRVRRRLAGEMDLYPVEVRYLRLGGVALPMEVSAAPITFDGKLAVQFIARDITERKRAESALAERVQLSALSGEIGTALTCGLSLTKMLQRCAAALVQHLDAAFARIWTLNQQTNVLELQASAGLYTHLDGPHGRVPVGKFKIGLIAQERKPHLTNQVLGDPRVGDQEWAKREGMVSFAGYPLVVDDRVVGVMALFARHPLPDATLQAMAGIADGITLGIERIRTEAALLASEERMRLQTAALESAANGVTITDAKGTIQWVNPAFTQLTGYSAEEAMGQNPRILKSGQHPESFYEQMWETISKGRSWKGEIINRHKNGQLYHEEITITPVRDARRATTHYIAIMQDIGERKRAQAELENLHKQLLEASRRGGMAEIATNVLHNVGNVLNSVNVSTGLIVESVKKSKASRLARVVTLLGEHAHDLGEFITNDPKGKQLPVYLAQLSDHLLAEQAAMAGELDSLRQNVEHIKEIVAMQQSYATFGGVKEMVNVITLVEDSLRMHEGALSRHGVEIIREFESVPPLNIEKHKILQILVNLLRNAKHACQDSESAGRRLTVRVTNGSDRIKISVMDNGVGIPPENLTRIFNHGFTTRKDGHGFGLHSGALAAKEMGGDLTVHSGGPGQGATFTLELPCITKQNSNE